MYTCGVTVYDQCHMGHARSLYVFDVIRRYLQHRGFQVKFVRNITDVDDKIIHKANELKKTSEEVARDNIALYYRDLESLGVSKADNEPRATENIPDIIKDVEGLIQKGFAYALDGDVYFNVRKFSGYGRLSGQSIEKMREAVRIEKGERKQDPLDFALWKKSKDGEPGWSSPWGEGRPGWHMECSCMSLKHLQCETLDIHAGGRDLIFPHHENEIAQAEALRGGTPFAKYWIHHGLITVNGQKMAKSAGNFITIQDALKKYPLDDLKLFFLFSHYASNIDFTAQKMEEAHKAMQKFDVLFWKAHDLLQGKKFQLTQTVDFVERHKSDFLAAMDDDFNTPKALAALFELISDINKFIDHASEDDNYFSTIYLGVDTIENLAGNIFGLFSKEAEHEPDEETRRLLEERRAARANKNFRRSDELRDTLKSKGIIVEDTKEGQVWRWA